MIKLLKYLKLKHWLMLAVGIALVVGQVYLDLTLPEYMNEITKLVQSQTGGIEDVLLNGGYMLGIALASGVLSVIVGFIAAYIAAGFSKNLRENMFVKVGKFSMEEIQKFSIPSLITRSTNDITQVQTIIAMGLQVLVKGPILAVWAVFKILNKSWQWSFAIGVAVLVLFVLIAVLIVFALPKFKKIQRQTDKLNLVARENLTGIRVVRAYNAEGFETDKFEKANTELTNTNLFTGRLMSLIQPGINFITSALSLAIYWIGAVLINQAAMLDKLTLFGDMVVFSSYAMQIVFAFIMMTMIFIMLPRASVSAKRIGEVLSTVSNITDGYGVVETESEGEVEFKNVSFKYPDANEYVLKDVSFVAKKGQTVAFVGSTGSGKSTLINLLPRFYDATEGEVLLNGVNVKDYTLEQLHSKIGYVAQKAVLFAGTVQSNILLGENQVLATENDIESALTISQSKFVYDLEEGVNSSVNKGGANLSGGQKQRLSIARAIAKKPEVLVFDDSFSALDYKTDKNLRKSLKKNMKDTTKLIVGQRIGTIKDADTIVVLDSGNVVGMGTHSQLLKTCEVYKEIASSQLSKEELENE